MSLKTHSANVITLALFFLKSKPPTWEKCLIKEKLNVSWLEVSFPPECSQTQRLMWPQQRGWGKSQPTPTPSRQSGVLLPPYAPLLLFWPWLRQITLRPRSPGRCQVSQELSVQQPIPWPRQCSQFPSSVSHTAILQGPACEELCI